MSIQFDYEEVGKLIRYHGMSRLEREIKHIGSFTDR